MKPDTLSLARKKTRRMFPPSTAALIDETTREVDPIASSDLAITSSIGSTRKKGTDYVKRLKRRKERQQARSSK